MLADLVRLPEVRAVSEPEQTDGGDPVCWLDRVCDACGALADGAPQAVCERCGTPRDGGRAADGLGPAP